MKISATITYKNYGPASGQYMVKAEGREIGTYATPSEALTAMTAAITALELAATLAKEAPL